MNAMKSWAAAAAMVTLTGAAQAALINRGGGMIYDTTRKITWLADMNRNGQMFWGDAVAWADNLVFGGFSDWRLPTLNPADTSCNLGPGRGYNCTGGELSGLFVTDLGNKANESVLNQVGDTAEQKDNLALFSKVQPSSYWSGTERAGDAGYAWYFGPSSGIQDYYKDVPMYAVAVRDGDVAAAVTEPPASVPEPQTLALTLLALGATVVARRRRTA